MNTPKKNDEDKPRMDIVLSIRGVEHVGQVFAYGAKKYDEFNWRKGGNSESFKRRMAAAAVRHITTYLQGTKLDAESGNPHLAHAISNLLMILDLECQERTNNNDHP